MYQDQSMFAQPVIKHDIVSLQVFDAGDYQPMYAHPYELHVSGDQLETLQQRVEHSGQGLAGFNSTMLNGVASTMLRPSMQEQHQIAIPNGWNVPRFRFILVVQETRNGSAVSTYYFQGFTSHKGIGQNGSFDPTMLFFINAYQRAVKVFNGISEDINITEKAQIVNGQLVRDPSVGDAFKMRPMDVYTTIQSNYIQQAYRNYSGDTANDTRIRMGGDSITNKRSNNVSGDYLTTLIANYGQASDLLSYGQGDNDLYSRAMELSYENNVDEINFLRRLSTVRGLPSQTQFSVADLLNIDGTASARFGYFPSTGRAAAEMPTGHNVGAWTERSNEMLWANILSNAMPTLMLDTMMGEVHFTVTNNSIGGQIVTQPHTFKSITGADTRNMFERLMRRVAQEIVSDFNKLQVSFTISIKVNLYHFAEFQISLNGQPFYRYQAPTFCDGLWVPTATSVAGHQSYLATQLEGLFAQLPSGGGVGGQPANSTSVNHQL